MGMPKGITVEKPCSDCGQTFAGSHLAPRCSACKRKHYLEYQRKYRVENPIGTERKHRGTTDHHEVTFPYMQDPHGDLAWTQFMRQRDRTPAIQLQNVPPERMDNWVRNWANG